MFIEIKIGKKIEKTCHKKKNLNDRHNIYGCSYLDYNGFKLYYVNYKLHNELGPAVIYSNDIYHYLNDKHYSHDEWLEQINKKDR